MSIAALRVRIIQVSRESGLLFTVFSLQNVSNYVFHVVISRMLGPSEYGALGAILAITLVLSVPLMAIQTAVAKRIAQAQHQAMAPEELATISGGLLRALVPVSLGFAVLLLTLNPLLTSVLRLDSWIITALLACFVVPTVLGSVVGGALQGMMRFNDLALLHVMRMVVRVSLGIGAVHLGSGVPGAVGASVLAEIMALGLGLWLLRRQHPLRLARSYPLSSFLREVRPVMSALAAIWLLIELDLMLARYFLPSTAAGEYVAAGTLARAVLFVPAAINFIALPHFSALRGRGQDAYNYLKSSYALIVSLAALAALTLSVFGHWVVAITYGDQFSGAGSLLPVMSFAMVGMSVGKLVVFFHVAAESRFGHLIWALSPIEVAVVAVWHESGQSIAMAVLVTSWVIALSGFVAARSIAVHGHPRSRLPDDLVVYPSQVSELAPEPELSVVVPTHNQASSLFDNLDSLLGTLDDSKRAYEVIVVSDGSTDGCEQLAVSAEGPLSVVHYPRRQGKGVALRVGMARARGHYVAFIDSDGDLDPKELRSFLALMDLYNPDLVIGSKRHPLSEVQYPMIRRILSWGYQHLVGFLFGLNVRDTQTGMKLIRRDVLDAVLPRMLQKRYAFDLEFLVIARRLGYRRVFEAPVVLNYRFRTTVASHTVFHILIDTIAIYYRRYILRTYDKDPAEQAVPVMSKEGGPAPAAVDASVAREGAVL